MTRTCTKCLKEKDITEFHKKSASHQSFCKSCQREYIRSHYQKNKTYYKDKAKAYAEKVKQYIRDIKEATPCQDCGIKYHFWIMQFDHISGTKDFNLAEASNHSIESIKEELSKCEVVCANCHANRTYLRSVGRPD